MGEGVKLSIWGTRGAFPAVLPDRMEYGGNTCCVSAELPDRILVVDAGSGLAVLGERIVERLHRGERIPGRIDLFISHLHLDHVIGLVHFQPFFEPEMEIHLYGETRDGQTLRMYLKQLIGPPWWPVGFSEFKAKLHWHEVRAGECYREAGGFSVSTLRANHPNQGILYRFAGGGWSLMYGLDCEMDGSVWEKLVDFSKNCGLLICDGTFDEAELGLKKGWGHSAWEQAVRLKEEAGAGKVLISHYAWESTDAILREREQAARRMDTDCFFAREGMEVWI